MTVGVIPTNVPVTSFTALLLLYACAVATAARPLSALRLYASISSMSPEPPSAVYLIAPRSLPRSTNPYRKAAGKKKIFSLESTKLTVPVPTVIIPDRRPRAPCRSSPLASGSKATRGAQAKEKKN
jgi:hypothetical protein